MNRLVEALAGLPAVLPAAAAVVVEVHLHNADLAALAADPLVVVLLECN